MDLMAELTKLVIRSSVYISNVLLPCYTHSWCPVLSDRTALPAGKSSVANNDLLAVPFFDIGFVQGF